MGVIKIEAGKIVGDVKIKNSLRTNPTCLGEVVNKLAKIPITEEEENFNVDLPFEIADKITHNDLGSYKCLIEDYPVYSKILEDVYSVVIQHNPRAKSILWKRIRNKYRQIKGELLKGCAIAEQMDLIKENSDKIIDIIKEYLLELLESSKNLNGDVPLEAIEESVEIIIGDAFVNCKILENPNN
ncbi:hypothetical protein GCQ56_00840 [Marinifilum sp. N1E240]|uniref:ABC-three component system protein n=1 Tax=Marinifilum sp. N1E240 TaxID=2608082 RepID=UPI00128E0BBA|nr:ABC-three component system protein [Marinifilum sp. N1E240]MPQ45538.1 hypothetical protein [Marinifilum sp. N1E240]